VTIWASKTLVNIIQFFYSDLKITNKIIIQRSCEYLSVAGNHQKRILSEILPTDTSRERGSRFFSRERKLEFLRSLCRGREASCRPPLGAAPPSLSKARVVFWPSLV
jgi:hypothetical protein